MHSITKKYLKKQNIKTKDTFITGYIIPTTHCGQGYIAQQPPKIY